MGIYWIVINLDKKERLELGRKFEEWLWRDDPKALFYLLVKDAHEFLLSYKDYELIWSNIRLYFKRVEEAIRRYKYLGRWAGDRVIILPDVDEYLSLIDECRDITKEVVSELIEVYMNWYERYEMDFLKEILENFMLHKKLYDEFG